MIIGPVISPGMSPGCDVYPPFPFRGTKSASGLVDSFACENLDSLVAGTVVDADADHLCLVADDASDSPEEDRGAMSEDVSRWPSGLKLSRMPDGCASLWAGLRCREQESSGALERGKFADRQNVLRVELQAGERWTALLLYCSPRAWPLYLASGHAMAR
jgi:hypothetical protein